MTCKEVEKMYGGFDWTETAMLALTGAVAVFSINRNLEQYQRRRREQEEEEEQAKRDRELRKDQQVRRNRSESIGGRRARSETWNGGVDDEYHRAGHRSRDLSRFNEDRSRSGRRSRRGDQGDDDDDYDNDEDAYDRRRHRRSYYNRERDTRQ
ncbi:unnamed protein product [Clonostachys rosea f. rosea IK726]|uniref:Uncharacterized protein n=1 Tax=Clonostachys rosea f. rosea IK726 TaxID=1349383 RepID=A0ACA9TDR1_BIOOC|nr:unnamed protein product [Clonostachys rosea f. rosea IK726]